MATCMNCKHKLPTKKTATNCSFCASTIPNTTIMVDEIPPCDFCKANEPKLAEYDGKTTAGPWAHMCSGHFRIYGVGLGLGKGQKLVAMV